MLPARANLFNRMPRRYYGVVGAVWEGRLGEGLPEGAAAGRRAREREHGLQAGEKGAAWWLG